MFDNLPAEGTPVADWTLDECSDYVAMWDEIEGENRAEYGSGAVSLGYDGNEAMAFYDGPRASANAEYVEARRRLRDEAEAEAERRHFAMIEDANEIRGFNDHPSYDDYDDIPF